MRGFSVETENFVERGRGGNKGGTQQGGKERFCVVEELVGQDIYKYKENSMGGGEKTKRVLEFRVVEDQRWVQFGVRGRGWGLD